MKDLEDLRFLAEIHPFIADHLHGLRLLCLLTLNDLSSALRESTAVADFYFAHPNYRNLSRFLLTVSRCDLPQDPLFPSFIRRIAVESAKNLALERSCESLLRHLLLRYPFLSIPPGHPVPPFSEEEQWRRIMTLAEEFRDKRSALHLAQSSGIATRKDLSPQRKLYLVKLAFEAREFSIARRWAEELLRGKGLKPEEKGDLDLLYYRILMRRNLPDSAFAFLSHALTQKDIPPSYQLAFLYRLGLLSEGKEDWKGAERFYFRAVTLAKGSREGEEVLVRLGLIWIQKGETERARRLWEENREGFSPSSEARFLYLIGRAEPSLLGENCRKISNSTPLSYYHFLCSREVPVPSDFFSSFTLPPLRFPKAELLEEIGFFEGSVWEWETYGLEVRDPLLRIAVAQKIHALGFPWTALSFLTRGVDITPWMRGDRRERELWEILYPLPYQEEVITASRKEELDPYLLYAVMRQESRFYPFAQSSANARGLLQLLWETAQSIAEMDLLQVSSPDDLYEPRRNILLGARYLKKLLNRFRGDLYLALASYNAGPARVEEWLKIELPRDLWVERIPIEETRNYVKKVLENYFRYRLLYNPPPPPPP